MNQDDDSNVVEEAASIRSVGCVCVCGDIACDSLGGVEMRAFVEPFVSLLATSRTYTLARSLWLWHHVLIWHRTTATGDFDCSTTCGTTTASDLDIARSCCTTTTNDHLIESSSECSVDLVVVRATIARHINLNTTTSYSSVRATATGDFDCSTTCGTTTASDLDIARSCCTTTTNDHLIESSSECSIDLVVVRATAARHISCTTTKHDNSSTSTNFHIDSHDKLVP